jgi:AcrR family transcriptional regulator
MQPGGVPKTADPSVRTALIEHAARITAEEGREALTLRRLAAGVGTSTMAVYTHFGGMDDLRRAVRREGFARLASTSTPWSAPAMPSPTYLSWAGRPT